MSSINTQSKVKLFYQSKISLWLKSRAAPARNYYDKTSWESLHCCTLHSMTPPAETETPPPLLHRSPSPLPSNTIPLLIALSFRMLSHHYPPSHLFFFSHSPPPLLLLPPTICSRAELQYSFLLKGGGFTHKTYKTKLSTHDIVPQQVQSQSHCTGEECQHGLECNGVMFFFCFLRVS